MKEEIDINQKKHTSYYNKVDLIAIENIGYYQRKKIRSLYLKRFPTGFIILLLICNIFMTVGATLSMGDEQISLDTLVFVLSAGACAGAIVTLLLQWKFNLPDKVFQHIKRRSVYEILFQGIAQVSDENPIKDNDNVVIYQGTDNAVYVRKNDDFFDQDRFLVIKDKFGYRINTPRMIYDRSNSKTSG